MTQVLLLDEMSKAVALPLIDNCNDDDDDGRGSNDDDGNSDDDGCGSNDNDDDDGSNDDDDDGDIFAILDKQTTLLIPTNHNS